MPDKMEYLDAFHEEGLEYSVEENRVHLWNLKELGGMEVAELLTYLYDDGYCHFGPMFSNEQNGYLAMLNPPDRKPSFKYEERDE